MHFDPAQRCLTASVRELLAAALPSRAAATASPWRARLGQLAHARYRALRAAEVEVVASEAPLSCAREVAGYRALVRGRADVIVREPDGALAIEEVKSVALSGEAFAEGADLGAACLQACLYALCLEEQERREGRATAVRARVALIDVHEDRYQAVEAGYEHGDTDARVRAALGELVALAEEGLARAARRAEAARQLVFPHAAPRLHQEELSNIVREGLEAGRPVLLSAPTGIGKTIAALLPALGFALGTDRRVLYLTAKTTQRSQVARAFEDVVRASALGEGAFFAITLRRKEEMCPPGHLSCHPRSCPWLVDLDERLEDSGVLDALRRAVHLSPEDVWSACSAEQLCPYYSARRLAAEAALVVGDFNHLLGAGPEGEPERTVVVIDEAHNLFDRAREQLSPFVGARALQRLERWLDAIERSVGAELPVGEEARRLCQRVGRGIAEELGDLEGRRDHDEADEPDPEALLDGSCPRALDRGRWQELATAAATLALRWSECRQREARWRLDLAEGRDPLLELADELARLADLLGAGEREMIPYVASRAAPGGRGVGVVCVDPSRRLEAHHRRAAGVVAMSATLTPLSYFSEVLGLSRLDPLLTSAPSPFPADRRLVRVVPTVSTTFREREASAPEVARLIERVVAVRPGCYAAFFPSFAYLSLVAPKLRLPPSQVLVQLPSMATPLRQRTLDRLRAAAGPVLLLAVMGGVFGEGIDLPGEALIGAIVVGPGMPAVSFERALMQRHFDERYEAGFAYAMVYPGLQRVIQAAGRVIRSEEDRGVIVLLGRRFAEGELGRCLPPHWYRHDPAELCCDDPVPALETFWNVTVQGGRIRDGGSPSRP